MNSQKKKISTSIPAEVLAEAKKLSGLTQTGALIEGLHELIKKKKRERLLSLEGKLSISWNVSTSRKRV